MGRGTLSVAAALTLFAGFAVVDAAPTAHAATGDPTLTWAQTPAQQVPPTVVHGTGWVFTATATAVAPAVAITKLCATIDGTPIVSDIGAGSGGYYNDLKSSNNTALFHSDTGCWTSAGAASPKLTGLNDLGLRPDTTGFTDGVHTIAITAYDDATPAKTTTIETSFTTQNLAPAVSFPYNTNGDTVHGAIHLTIIGIPDSSSTAQVVTWCLKRDGAIETNNVASQTGAYYGDLLSSNATFNSSTGCWTRKPGPPATLLQDGTVAYDTTSWPDGNHTFEFTVTDTTPRTTVGTITLHSVNGPPTLTIDSAPVNGAIDVTGAIRVAATATADPTGTAWINQWCLTVDGKPASNGTAQSSMWHTDLATNSAFSAGSGCFSVTPTDGSVSLHGGDFTYDTAALANGPHDFSLIVHDSAGHTTSNSFTLTTASQGAPVQVSTGSTHSCAVLTAKTVACSGDNEFGELGDGTTTSHTHEVKVTSLTDVDQVVTGTGFTCALTKRTTTGKVKCWGRNDKGQLGDNSTTRRTSPVETVKAAATALTGVKSLAAGSNFVCAVIAPGAAGQAWCWGNNSSGQLGDGSTSTRKMAVHVKTGARSYLVGVVSISAGADSACAVLNSGKVSCWGRNTYGQLGNGSTATSKFATATKAIDGTSTKAASVTVGNGFACALLKTTKQVMCWGRNNAGQLGDRTFTTRKSPVKVKLANNAVLTAVIALSAGDSHVCAVSATKVWCWGLNSKGQLGIGTTTSKNAATVVGKPTLLTPKNITCAGYETLLFGTSTAVPKQPVYAWGNNDKGQLGDGTTTTRTSPVALTDLRGLSPHT